MNLHRIILVMVMLCILKSQAAYSAAKKMEECALNQIPSGQSMKAVSKIYCASLCLSEPTCELHVFNKSSRVCTIGGVPENVLLNSTECDTNVTVYVVIQYAEKFDGIKRMIQKEVDSCYFEKMTNMETGSADHLENCLDKCRLGNCEMFSFDTDSLLCRTGQLPITNCSTICPFSHTGKKLNAYVQQSKVDNLKNCSEGEIVIQRRLNGTQPFDKTWVEYKNGFGDLNEEFWLGNEKLHQLTSAGSMTIRFDLWDKDDNHAHAEYSSFSVSGEGDKYRLSISGYSGSAGDSMSRQNSKQFSTKDNDNDEAAYSCSNYYGDSGWWFADCYDANLNGIYLTPGGTDWAGIIWTTFIFEDNLKTIIIRIK